MKVIKNNLIRSIESRSVRHVFPLALIAIPLHKQAYELMQTLGFQYVVLVVNAYLLLATILISYTNPTFIFNDRSLIIKHHFLFKWLDKDLSYSSIRQATFKHESQGNTWFNISYFGWLLEFFYDITLGLLFPYEHKWVKIETAEQTFLIFCYGLEYDYYDNFEEIRFEHLKLEFESHKIPSKWTPNNDPYFQ